MKIAKIEISDESIKMLCDKWKIQRMALFGSALSDCFNDESDIDILVDFFPDERWSLMDLIRAEMEFSRLMGRKVDIVERNNLEKSTNWIRRDAILNSAKVVYVSQ